MSNPDRVDTWDQNKVAEALFGPEGGIAVWFDFREDAPRCASRGAKMTECVYGAAMLTIGTRKILEMIGEATGIGNDEAQKLHDELVEELKPRIQSAARLWPAKNPRTD